MTAHTLSDYEEVVGPDVIEELTILASHVGKKSLKMVNCVPADAFWKEWDAKEAANGE